MNNEKRIKNGYEIIESCTIGNSELVIGHNPKAVNPYVCWYCINDTNYTLGYYCNDIANAREKLMERYRTESGMPYNQSEKITENTVKRPTFEQVKTVAEYENKHNIPTDERQTDWYGDYNMYEPSLKYSAEKFYAILEMAENENVIIANEIPDKGAASPTKLSIRFAKKQIFGEHIVTVNGQEIPYVNIALPKTSKHHGYSLSIKKDNIHEDKFNPKMAFAAISDKSYSLSKFDKDTKSTQEIQLNGKQIKKEFDSWKEKKRDTPAR